MVRVPGYRSRGSGFDSRLYQIFWEAVGLEQSPLSLVSKTKEVFGRKSSVSGLEIREYGLRDPSRWPRGTLFTQKLLLTSPTSGCRSVGIVRSRTQATEFVCLRMFIRLPCCLLLLRHFCMCNLPPGNVRRLALIFIKRAMYLMLPEAVSLPYFKKNSLPKVAATLSKPYPCGAHPVALLTYTVQTYNIKYIYIYIYI
jgi:hypothetical protein